MMSDPERIWLQPECCICPSEGRQWCEDSVWPDNDDCDQAGVEYVRADTIQSLTAKLERAKEGLNLVAMQRPVITSATSRRDHADDLADIARQALKDIENG